MPVTAAVAQLDRLRDDPLDPQVGVLGAELTGPAERGVGQRREREGAELGVDAVERHGRNLSRRRNPRLRVISRPAPAARRRPR